MTDRKMWKTGLSVRRVEGCPCEEWFDRASRCGIDYFEISQNGSFEEYVIDWKNLPKWEEKYGVKIWTFHIPEVVGKAIYHPAIIDPEKWKEAYKLYEYWANHCGEAGIKRAVIHPSVEPYRTPEIREAHMQASIEHLGIISDLCKKNGVTLAVENLPRTCLGNCSDEMLRFMQSNSDLRICFDVNHLLKEDHEQFVKKVGKYIVTTHISDYDFIDEAHLFPMQGQINWRKIQSLLESVDYEGPLMYEVELFGHNWEDVRRNHEFLKDL